MRIILFEVGQMRLENMLAEPEAVEMLSAIQIMRDSDDERPRLALILHKMKLVANIKCHTCQTLASLDFLTPSQNALRLQMR